MPSDDKPENPQTPKLDKVKSTSSQMATAMELPFTFVAAVVVGGLIGYFLDQWLHTGPWLMIVLGCFGFAGGILEIMKRFRPGDSGGNHDQPGS
jgi:ATP synthase protein I